MSVEFIVLMITCFLIASVTTFDIRIIQAKRAGAYPEGEELLPQWVAYLHWLEWLVFIGLVFLNWKIAILIFAIKFILKVLPVLEALGNFLMGPFKSK